MGAKVKDCKYVMQIPHTAILCHMVPINNVDHIISKNLPSCNNPTNTLKLTWVLTCAGARSGWVFEWAGALGVDGGALSGWVLEWVGARAGGC